MPPEHVGESRAEHVNVQKRVVFSLRSGPAILESLLDLAQLRCQSAGPVIPEQVAALGHAEALVAVLGQPHLFGGEPGGTPAPGSVACQPGPSGAGVKSRTTAYPEGPGLRGWVAGLGGRLLTPARSRPGRAGQRIWPAGRGVSQLARSLGRRVRLNGRRSWHLGRGPPVPRGQIWSLLSAMAGAFFVGPSARTLARGAILRAWHGRPAGG